MADKNLSFTAEDLSLLAATDGADDDGEGTPAVAADGKAAAGDGKEGEAQAKGAADQGKAGKAASEGDGKDQSKAGGDKSARRAATIVDDVDDDEDDGDDAEPAEKAKGKGAKADAEDDGDKDGEEDEEGDKKAKAKDGVDPTAWREEYANGVLAKLKGKIPDDKIESRRKAIMNNLMRYKTPFDAWIGGFSAQERIRAGELKSKLAADASDEEIAAWREENGIPAKAKDYEVPNIAGYKWTEGDKPLIESFKEYAHKKHYTQDQMEGAAEWYVHMMQKSTSDQVETVARVDGEDRQEVIHALRTELGPKDFKPRVKLLDRLLNDENHMPDGLGTAISSARYYDANGVSHRLINNPNMARVLMNYAVDTYGDNTFGTADGKTTSSSVIEEADRIMDTDWERYHREGWGEKRLQAVREQENSKSTRRKAA